MKPIYQLTKIKPFLLGAIAVLVMASCGSYEYAGYEDDGIYSSEAPEAYADNGYERTYNETDPNDKSDYYEQLFAQQSNQIENLPNGGMIFTDVDSYTSTGSYEDELYRGEGLNYTSGYPGWGDQTDGVAINIYNTSPFYSSFHNPYWSPYYSGFYGPYGYGYSPYGYGYGYGHYGYGFGWNNWGWNIGFGYHNPWRYNYWGWHGAYAYNPYWHGGYYANRYPYLNENVSYNTGRRSSYTDYNRRSNAQSSRSSRISSDDDNTRRVRRSVRSSRNADNDDAYRVRSNRRSSNDDNRTYRTRTTRAESNTDARERRSYRSSENRSYTPRTRATQRSRSTRQPAVRSAPTRTRAVRSAPTRTRSSGTRTSRSSRGRGGR